MKSFPSDKPAGGPTLANAASPRCRRSHHSDVKNAGRLNSAHGRQTACSLNGKMEPARGHAPRSRPYQDRTSLSMFCRLGPGGRTCTSVARWAARLQRAAFAVVRCARAAHPSRCSGLRHLRAAALRLPRLDENWALGRDSHPRPFPYEGTALTAAPPSENAALASQAAAEVVEAAGLSPATCRLRAGCSGH